MRVVAALALVVVVAAVVLLPGGGEKPDYQVAATFDTAKGMVPGQLVKIAGARVGKVTRVDLAPGPKARLTLKLKARFGPFHDDARCHILPEGLISEYYVECEPGTPARPALPQTGGVASLPLTSTTVPVGLQDIFDVFSMPTAQRARILINELGIATAGRGDDINAILRRANPSLTSARKTLGVINAQNAHVAAAVDQTDRVLARVETNREDLRGFVRNVASTVDAVDDHAPALSATLRDLPPMLDATRAGLAGLRATAAGVTPILGDLRAAAPQLTRLSTTLPSFTRSGSAALRALHPALREVRRTIPVAQPVVTQLSRLARRSRQADLLAQFLIDLRDKGGFESFTGMLYSLGAAVSSYDRTSHVIPLIVQLYANCIADPSAKGCSHKYDAPGTGAIPINDPDGKPYIANEPGGSRNGSASRTANQRPPSREQLKSLLGYLLG